MADEARLHELLDLVEQARSEGDKDTEAKAAAAYKRESAPAVPAQDPAQFGGAGGYNPMLARLGGAQSIVSNELGMTPENTASPIKNALGPAETALHYATAGVAMPVAGVAGLGQSIWNTIVPKRFEGQQGANAIRDIQQAMTYQPRTGSGAGMARVAGAPMEAYGAGTNKVGEFAADKTGSPLVGAALKTGLDAGPALLSRGRAEEMPIARSGKYTAPGEVVPTTEQLGKAATDAYKRADDAGIAVNEQSFSGMKSKLADALSKEGIDPTLHPNATAALKRVTEETGPVTLQKLETLRRVALDAEDTLVKADAKKAGDIVDHIDDYVDNLSDSELTSGQAKDAAALKEARALYTRKRKSEDIERLIRRAEYSPSGFENGLRIEFRSLAKNDRRFNRFNAEEKAAIDKVAKGGMAENALRLLSKAAPTGIVSGGLSTGAGFAFGGPLGAVALPAAGIAGRLGAKALTTRNAQAAAETMRRGPQASGGLLAKDNPTPLVGGPQTTLAESALRAPAKARSAEAIQADIRKLAAQAQFELSRESASSPKVQLAVAQLQALQRELAATQAGQ